ncbi:MAG: penicillin-insensitive murein endopeptidase [Bdellovibrionota bacterium]
MVSFLLLFLVGCGKYTTAGYGGFERDAVPTAPRITEANPYTYPIEMNQGGVSSKDFDSDSGSDSSPKLVMGHLSVKAGKISFNQKEMKLRIAGTLVMKDSEGKTTWEKSLEMDGVLSADGFVNLMKPARTSDSDLLENLRGRGMCFEDAGYPCTHAVVELVYRDSEKMAHGLQLETREALFVAPPPKPTVTPPPKPSGTPAPKPNVTPAPKPNPPVKPGSPAPKPTPAPAPVPAPQPPVKEEPKEIIIDEDPTLKPDLYIGTLHEDWRKLYEDENPTDKPDGNSPTPAPAPVPAPVPSPVIPKEETKPGTTPPAPVTPSPVPTPTPPTPGPAPAPAPSPVTPAPIPTPAPTSPAPNADRPWDQAIGPASTITEGGKTLSGSLKNGTYLISENQKSPKEKRLNLYLPGDDHLYGTWELVQLLKSMGVYAIDLKVPLYVGDLAKKGGGVVPPHKSHQNGLDVDVGYPFLNADKFGGTPDTVNTKGETAAGIKVKEMYELFKYAYSTGSMNIILVHPGIKKLLCNEAERRGELSADGKTGSALVLMSKIRPEINHDKHFHLRIKCSKYQRKCRTTTEPAKVSGC